MTRTLQSLLSRTEVCVSLLRRWLYRVLCHKWAKIWTSPGDALRFLWSIDPDTVTITDDSVPDTSDSVDEVWTMVTRLDSFSFFLPPPIRILEDELESEIRSSSWVTHFSGEFLTSDSAKEAGCTTGTLTTWSGLFRVVMEVLGLLDPPVAGLDLDWLVLWLELWMGLTLAWTWPSWCCCEGWGSWCRSETWEW